MGRKLQAFEFQHVLILPTCEIHHVGLWPSASHCDALSSPPVSVSHVKGHRVINKIINNTFKMKLAVEQFTYYDII